MIASPSKAASSKGTWAGLARRIRVPLGFVFAAIYLWLADPRWSSIAAGLPILLSGIALRGAASGQLRKNTELATTGPYAYTRNPLYLGSLLIAAGFGIAGRNPWIGLGIVALLLGIYYPVILSEEEYLRTHFTEFEDYRERVPRLIPRFTSRGNPGRFSPELYRKHREYNAIIGSAFLIAALVGKMWLLHRF